MARTLRIRTRARWLLLCGAIALGWLILAVPPGFLAGEPSDDQLRVQFEEHQAALDGLRRQFEADSAHLGLEIVSASVLGWTRCKGDRQGTNCLAWRRWAEYAWRLRRAGVRGIRREETPGLYFEIHWTTAWTEGEFRYRGLVYAPGSPKVVHDHDDTEERVELRNGWYSYLIIDQ
jgi:hypothetical protein